MEKRMKAVILIIHFTENGLGIFLTAGVVKIQCKRIRYSSKVCWYLEQGSLLAGICRHRISNNEEQYVSFLVKKKSNKIQSIIEQNLILFRRIFYPIITSTIACLVDTCS